MDRYPDIFVFILHVNQDRRLDPFITKPIHETIGCSFDQKDNALILLISKSNLIIIERNFDEVFFQPLWNNRRSENTYKGSTPNTHLNLHQSVLIPLVLTDNKRKKSPQPIHLH